MNLLEYFQLHTRCDEDGWRKGMVDNAGSLKNLHRLFLRESQFDVVLGNS